MISLFSIFMWLLLFKLDKGSNVKYSHRGGGGDEPSPPPPIDPVAQAQAQVDAQIAARPRAAEAEFNILTNPQFGLEATTAEFERVRQSVFPGEQGVRSQLVSNILAQLESPTGITEEQQTAIDARRGRAREEITRGIRTRANLGGGLFGGRSQLAEQRAVGEFEQATSEEDINRQERNRLNNSQLALQVLNILFPGANIQPPSFINPVASPETAFSGSVTQRGQDITASTAAAQQQAALQSSLFSALGTGVGGFAGGVGEAGGVTSFFS